MLEKNSTIILLLAFTLGCQIKKDITDDNTSIAKKSSTESKYPRWVDDIEFDPALDDEAFKVCDGDSQVIQYFNNGKGVEYKGDKLAIEEAFQENYDASKAAKESGLVRIRFIVNCEGKTGRFRILAMDEAYDEKQFDTSVTDQLLAITKSLDGWKPKVDRGNKVDYYQYLIFKIQNGEIVKILP